MTKRKSKSLTKSPTYTVEILGRLLPVRDMVHASNLVDQVIAMAQAGASEIGAQFQIRENGIVIGWVSYNGRVWKGDPRIAKGILAYDPSKKGEEPQKRSSTEASWCPHRTNKDYTRPGELFARCGWCDTPRGIGT